MDPIVSIFGVCDAEADNKVSMKEIKGNADCWNMLENAGMQNTSVTDEFSMIDKDQDGYVSMDEAYDAAQTLDRKGDKTNKSCHKNCAKPEKCLQYEKCKQFRNKGWNVTCDCKTGECQADVIYFMSIHVKTCERTP